MTNQTSDLWTTKVEKTQNSGLSQSGFGHSQPVFVCIFTLSLQMRTGWDWHWPLWNSPEFCVFSTFVVQRSDVCSGLWRLLVERWYTWRHGYPKSDQREINYVDFMLTMGRGSKSSIICRHHLYITPERSNWQLYSPFLFFPPSPARALTKEKFCCKISGQSHPLRHPTPFEAEAGGECLDFIGRKASEGGLCLLPSGGIRLKQAWPSGAGIGICCLPEMRRNSFRAWCLFGQGRKEALPSTSWILNESAKVILALLHYLCTARWSYPIVLDAMQSVEVIDAPYLKGGYFWPKWEACYFGPPSWLVYCNSKCYFGLVYCHSKYYFDPPLWLVYCHCIAILTTKPQTGTKIYSQG